MQNAKLFPMRSPRGTRCIITDFLGKLVFFSSHSFPRIFLPAFLRKKKLQLRKSLFVCVFKKTNHLWFNSKTSQTIHMFMWNSHRAATIIVGVHSSSRLPFFSLLFLARSPNKSTYSAKVLKKKRIQRWKLCNVRATTWRWWWHSWDGFSSGFSSV